MNRFDNLYFFKRASINDTDMIMEFYKNEWPKKNHILANSKSFFLYEFGNDEFVNFVIAINRQTNNIDGSMGYLPASSLQNSLDIWTCMWLTRRKGSVPFLGVEIIKRMKDIINYRYLSGVGTNPQTALPIVRDKINHYIFKLDHYYMLSNQEKYSIAKISKRIILNKQKNLLKANLERVYCITEIEDIIRVASKFSIPLKDSWYINKRYFNHPVYKYIVWVINTSVDKGILIGRELKINDIKILRIVDFIGQQQLLDGLYDDFHMLINNNNYEYIDFYIHGISDTHLLNAGFIKKDEYNENIIPNYFEPFEQKNIEIFGTSEVENVRMCKADADQDRPNNLN